MLKFALLPFVLIASLPCFAQDGRAARYAFIPVTEGTLRLDTKTGEVSLCTATATGISCAALRNDSPELALRSLETRLAAVEARLVVIEGGGAQSGALERVRVLASRMVEPLAKAILRTKHHGSIGRLH
jgi:hypothetical protein